MKIGRCEFPTYATVAAVPRLRTLPAFAAALVSAAAMCRAELPPDAYRQMQSAAPEALQVTVQKVNVRKAAQKEVTVSTVAAEARVDEVKRTATKLKAGDVIRITYEHRRRKMPIVGPSEPDIIEKGRSYAAFLRKGVGGGYGVAAGGYSFRKLE
jgi:ribosomal protein L24